MRGAVTSTGQVCFSIERIYVHQKVHDAFVDLLVKEARRVELNYPDPARGQIGPFIAERQSAIVDEHLDDAVRRGATVEYVEKTAAGGNYLVVVKFECRFRRPAGYDDLLRLRTILVRTTAVRVEHRAVLGQI